MRLKKSARLLLSSFANPTFALLLLPPLSVHLIESLPPSFFPHTPNWDTQFFTPASFLTLILPSQHAQAGLRASQRKRLFPPTVACAARPPEMRMVLVWMGRVTSSFFWVRSCSRQSWACQAWRQGVEICLRVSFTHTCCDGGVIIHYFQTRLVSYIGSRTCTRAIEFGRLRSANEKKSMID